MRWSDFLLMCAALEVATLVHLLGHVVFAALLRLPVALNIGFGPAIPKCRIGSGCFRFALRWFPLGGYVTLLPRPAPDGPASVALPAPHLLARSVPFVCGGIMFNLLLAWILFTGGFSAGIERKAGVIDRIDTGAPAYVAGAKSGDIIVQIGEVRDPYFEDLMVTVMSTTSGDRLDFIIADPGTKKGQPGYRELTLEPRRTSSDSRPVIGVSPPLAAQFDARRYHGRTLEHPTLPHTAAEKAAPPLEFGDRILATTDPDDVSKLIDLPLDPRKNDNVQRDYFEFARRMSVLAGKDVVIEVQRENGERVKVKLPPAFHNTFGARMEMGRVTAVRKNGPAQTGGVQADDPANARGGDLIEWVAVSQPEGGATVWAPVASAFAWGGLDVRPLDPYRLPDELLAWSRAMDRAGKGGARTVTLHVERHRKKAGNEVEKAALKLTWDPAYENSKEIPMGVNAGVSVPGLGLAYRVAPNVASADARPGDRLRPGDVIKDVRYRMRPAPDTEARWYPWLAEQAGKFQLDGEAGGEQWAYWTAVGLQLLRSPDLDEVEFKVERDFKLEVVHLSLERAVDWAMEDRGLLLAQDTRIEIPDGAGEAALMGLRAMRDALAQAYRNLRGVIAGRVSAGTLGGPVTVARVPYESSVPFWWFLATASMFLVVWNVLPIPPMDCASLGRVVLESGRGRVFSDATRLTWNLIGGALLFAAYVWLSLLTM